MKKLISMLLAGALFLSLAACGTAGGGKQKSEPPSQSQPEEPEPSSPALEPEEPSQSEEPPAYVTDILYFSEEWTARLAQLQEDESLWEREEEVRELASLLLEKAEYICRLAYQEAHGVLVTGNNWETEVTVEGRSNPYYKVQILPYHDVAELWADIYSVYQKEAADDAFGAQYKNLYIDINGELYTQGGVDSMSKHRIWNMDTAKIAEAAPDKLALEMEAQIMDEIFPARLELVREEGRWVLTGSYFASPQG